jgi:hypothetical protein
MTSGARRRRARKRWLLGPCRSMGLAASLLRSSVGETPCGEGSGRRRRWRNSPTQGAGLEMGPCWIFGAGSRGNREVGHGTHGNSDYHGRPSEMEEASALGRGHGRHGELRRPVASVAPWIESWAAMELRQCHGCQEGAPSMGAAGRSWRERNARPWTNFEQ